MTKIPLGTVGQTITFTFVDLSGAAVNITGATIAVAVTSPSGAVQTLTGAVVSGPAGTASVLTPSTVYTAAGQWTFRATATVDSTHVYPSLAQSVSVE